MTEIILKTHDLTKKYGNQLSNNKINISIKKGEIYGLIGKNGAGKTTFMRLITGLIHRTSGEIELFGKSSERELDEGRTFIGSLIESPAFYGDMTAKENLHVSRLIRNIPGEESLDGLLQLVGLGDVVNKKVKKFSLGMKQRLGIANAMLGNPRLLILDEPINGLDPMGIVEIRELLKKINKEKETTILISSHILEELSELATYYGILNGGKLVEEISVKEFNEKCRQYIELKVDDVARASSILERDLQIDDYEILENNYIKIFSHLDCAGLINSTLSKKGIVVDQVELKGEKLEDYFMDKVGGADNE